MRTDSYLPIRYRIDESGIPASRAEIQAEINSVWNDASQETLKAHVIDTLGVARDTGKTRPGDVVTVDHSGLDLSYTPQDEQPLAFTISRNGVMVFKQTMRAAPL